MIRKLNMPRLLIGAIFVLLRLQTSAQSVNDSPVPRISLPGLSWALQVNAPGFVVTQNVTQPDGRRYLLAANDAFHVTLSITLENTGGQATLDGCRQVFRGRVQPNGPLKLTEIKQLQIGEMAVLDYM